MVCAPNVDNLIEASYGKLIVMICDISGKIGRIAVCTDKNLIFFTAEIGSLIPYGTILFVGETL